MVRNRLPAVLVVLLLAMALFGLWQVPEATITGAATEDAGSLPLSTATVRVTNEGFSPSTLAIAPNTAVTFMSSASTSKRLASDDLRGFGRTIDPGQSYTYLVADEGEATYYLADDKFGTQGTLEVLPVLEAKNLLGQATTRFEEQLEDYIIHFTEPSLGQQRVQQGKGPDMRAEKAQLAVKRNAMRQAIQQAIGKALVDQAPTGNQRQVLWEMDTALNAIGVRMTEEEAETIRGLDGVESVTIIISPFLELDNSVPALDVDDIWQLQDAHGLGLTGKDIRVGVIDGGVAYLHPDLGGCLGLGCKVEAAFTYEYSVGIYPDDTLETSMSAGHGTHVAGILAANGQLKGVAPDAKIWAFKGLTTAFLDYCIDPNQDGDFSDHLDICTMSFGNNNPLMGYNPDHPRELAIETAVDNGVVATASAGNGGAVSCPGCGRKDISVRRADCSTGTCTLQYYGSVGPVSWYNTDGEPELLIKPDVTAPGTNVNSTYSYDGSYYVYSGTSMSAPYVAGIAAILLQAYPEATPLQIKQALMLSADWNSKYQEIEQGAGLVNPMEALRLFSTDLDFSPLIYPEQPWFLFDDAVTSTATRTITLRNDGSQSITLSVSGGSATGLIVSPRTTSITVPAGGSASVQVDVSINNPPQGRTRVDVQFMSPTRTFSVPVFTVVHQELSLDYYYPVTAIENFRVLDSSPTQVTFGWDHPNKGIRSFNIYRNYTPYLNPQYVYVDKTTSLNISVPVNAGETYRFTVKAVHYVSGWATAQTEAIEISIPGGTDVQPPSSPTNLLAPSVTANSIELSWDASTDNYGVAGYKVQRAGAAVQDIGDATAYVDQTVMPSTQYSYDVWAYDFAGLESAKSSIMVTTPSGEDIIPPAPPMNVQVTGVSASSVSLSWGAAADNVGVEGYRVYRNNVTVATTQSLSFTDNGVQSSTSYVYTIESFDAAGLSAFSNPVTASTLAVDQPPTTPQNLRVDDVTQTQVALRWDASTDDVEVKGYRVYVDGVYKGATSSTYYLRSSLLPGTTYEFFVRAYDNGYRLSNPSNTVTATTLTAGDTEPPTPPMNLRTVDVTTQFVNLRWDAASDNIGVAQYRIYRDDVLRATETALNYSDTVEAESSYQYFVMAVDSSDLVSGPSNTILVHTPAAPDTQPPSTPTNLQASNVQSSQLTLSWSPSTDNIGVAGYRVYRDGNTIGQTAGTSFQDTGLQSSRTYEYRVQAVDVNNLLSSASAPLSITTTNAPDTQPPTAPTNLHTTSVSYDQVNLAWDRATDNIGVAGYRVYRNGAYLGQTSGLSFGDATVVSSAAYYYTVRAYDAAGLVSQDSLQLPVTTPSEPTATTLTGTVTNLAGSALSGVTVDVKNPNARGKKAVVASASTNSQGQYVIVLSPGQYTLEFSKSGYSTYSTIEAVNGLTVIDVVLGADAVAAGECSDGTDNDRDGTCDFEGCVEKIRGKPTNLPPDSGCTSLTDPTE